MLVFCIYVTLWGQVMQLRSSLLNALAIRLKRERMIQDLSREELAAVCGVSPSFIHDADEQPWSLFFATGVATHTGAGLEGNDHRVGERDFRAQCTGD